MTRRTFNDDEKFFRRFFAAGLAAWVIGAAAVLAFWGLIGWAIVALVTHFTS